MRVTPHRHQHAGPTRGQTTTHGLCRPLSCPPRSTNFAGSPTPGTEPLTRASFMSPTGGLTTIRPDGINNIMTLFEFTFVQNDYALVCARDHDIKFCQTL